ncbi:hypothetical protein ACFVFS_20140 [Kitasatospora sp. NPDC057692]|uniref:hypothetical protein n=1 Tax=Kitasatospora sp. NPDC057692 TaxID=3346215 RepID=UPI00369BA655
MAGLAAAVVLALGAAACTAQGGDGGAAPAPSVVVRPAPAEPEARFAETAPASAQWIVDFGGGKEFTIVEYAFLRPKDTGPTPPPEHPSPRARVCPAVGACRPARAPG